MMNGLESKLSMGFNYCKKLIEATPKMIFFALAAFSYISNAHLRFVNRIAGAVRFSTPSGLASTKKSLFLRWHLVEKYCSIPNINAE